MKTVTAVAPISSRFGAVAIDRDCRRQRDHADRRQIAYKGHRSCSNVDANAANDRRG